MPGLTAIVKHDDHAMTWYDHGKIMPWQPCFSNPGDQLWKNKTVLHFNK